jgi:flagellar hook-basal body complex protein FliE
MVDPVSAARAYQQAARAAQNVQGTEGADHLDFGHLVQQAVHQAGQTAQVAETSAMQVAAGQGNIVDVVTAISAAETQLETVMAVRDQVIQAYQEILRMPI